MSPGGDSRDAAPFMMGMKIAWPSDMMMTPAYRVATEPSPTTSTAMVSSAVARAMACAVRSRRLTALTVGIRVMTIGGGGDRIDGFQRQRVAQDTGGLERDGQVELGDDDPSRRGEDRESEESTVACGVLDGDPYGGSGRGPP